MRLSSRWAGLVLMVLFFPSAVALACLWDYDTLKMERSRFPSALELITGKFLRHSAEFYQWRIEDRLKRLQDDPTNVALLDDLAVAYDKTGQHDRAIETAIKTEELQPGRYETAANLGTFYIHSGQLEQGLVHIDRALTINPGAHFGRERYQKLLVEYVLNRRQDGRLVLPLESTGEAPKSFVDFIPRPVEGKRPSFEELQDAIKGVLGMMKFGKHDAPVLLEALGSLLARAKSPSETDGKMLASRAYLKAAIESPDATTRSAYRDLARKVLSRQTTGDGSYDEISLERVESEFAEELADAKAWYANLRERELAWIRDGKDPEAEFDKLYDAEPEVFDVNADDPISFKRFAPYAAVAAVALAFGAAFFAMRRTIGRLKRRSEP